MHTVFVYICTPTVLNLAHCLFRLAQVPVSLAVGFFQQLIITKHHQRHHHHHNQHHQHNHQKDHHHHHRHHHHDCLKGSRRICMIIPGSQCNCPTTPVYPRAIYVWLHLIWWWWLFPGWQWRWWWLLAKLFPGWQWSLLFWYSYVIINNKWN